MKKLMTVLMLIGVLLAGSATVEAKTTTKRKSTTTKKKTTSVLPVTKGEIKKYGDYLTTQVFSIKKGKDNKVTIEYPIAGNEALVNAIRQSIKNSLDDKFTGSLQTPEALLRSVMKGKKDMEFGMEGESLEEDIFVKYHSPNIITYEDSGYSYMGGAHGIGWVTGDTFLVDNGEIFDISMLPDFSKMRPYIMEGIARNFDVEVYQLNDYLFNPDEVDYSGTYIITPEGITFIYQPYEIADFATGIIKATVPVTNEVLNMLTPEGREFFK